MKKKLLSLVLAGAMVASTSVSAFATENKEVEIQPNSEKEVEVQVRGDIESSTGDVVAGTIAVTVPTNASFRVDSNGTLTSATMSIVNKGESKISVIASSFKDTTGTQGINLVKEESNLSESDRSKVYLKLTGGDKDIILTSEENGKMYDATDKTEITTQKNFVIKNINAKEKLDLQLQGRGTAYSSEHNSEAAVNDNFKLVLKIKQER